MYPDGLCKLDDHTWSKCIEFEDVNYQLAKPDDQTAIFEALCDMYNAHDASIGMQLSLVSRRMNREDFVKRIEIAAQGDHFDHIRELYTQMLRKQLERGNNGLIKTKYLTLTIEARDSKTARARFSRIVMDALNHFKVMGALAKELGGKEWLEMLHGILHPDGERFAFEWSWLAPSGLSVQDFIAPSSFRFGEARKFTMADKFCAVSFLQISAPEMDDRMLTELLDTDSGLLVSLHIRSMDQNEAIKTVKRKITDIDSMKIDAQKKAVREGFDMDIIPTDLATYAGEAKNILRDLQSRNERMFLMTFLVVNFADSKQKLENDLLRAASVAQKYNCSLVRLDFQQEDGFVSALPLGVNRIKIQRGLTTSAVAVFVPFTTQEIFHGDEALYYGLNATSGNMILADRKKLKTPNGMILGTPGSGKSFQTKREITNTRLAYPGDEIIILDLLGPEKAVVEGRKEPILDMLRAEAPATHREEGQTLNLKGEKPVANGALKPGNGWQEVKFGQTVKGRYFCLEALDAQDGKDNAAMAEFYLLDEDGKPLPRQHWNISYADSESTQWGNFTADKIYDLQESTYWSTKQGDKYPHQVVIDLKEEQTISGFRYLPRAEEGFPGMIKGYKAYVKATPFAM